VALVKHIFNDFSKLILRVVDGERLMPNIPKGILGYEVTMRVD
jgi:hypothetical protein